MTPNSASFLIVGLGNPGRTYRGNRHNVGFMLLDRLAESWGLTFSRQQFDALIAEGLVQGEKVRLAKPETFVNLSGRPVASLLRYYKLPLRHLLVAHDDMDIPLGTLRMRPEGGSGGHKGMRSIQENLGTQGFPRLRIGIGRPPGNMDPAAFVLQDFSDQEAEIMGQVLERAVEFVSAWLLEGIDVAMTRFNGAVM